MSAENTDQAVKTLKVICLGDSAVGKSKLLERFLCDKYKQFDLSTHAVNVYKYETTVNDVSYVINFWDTAGQERFNELHVSYFYQAHACILVFDVTRKITYKNLIKWYEEMRQLRPDIPCICLANKIDAEPSAESMEFKFPKRHRMPFFKVSASDGRNVVRAFRLAAESAAQFSQDPSQVVDQINEELDLMDKENPIGGGIFGET